MPRGDYYVFVDCRFDFSLLVAMAASTPPSSSAPPPAASAVTAPAVVDMKIPGFTSGWVDLHKHIAAEQVKVEAVTVAGVMTDEQAAEGVKLIRAALAKSTGVDDIIAKDEVAILFVQMLLYRAAARGSSRKIREDGFITFSMAGHSYTIKDETWVNVINALPYNYENKVRSFLKSLTSLYLAIWEGDSTVGNLGGMVENGIPVGFNHLACDWLDTRYAKFDDGEREVVRRARIMAFERNGVDSSSKLYNISDLSRPAHN